MTPSSNTAAIIEPTARILIVDDDPSLLKLLSMRLSAANYEVETAGNAHTALAKLPRCKPQLVITDLRMEGMDGLSLFEEIQKRYSSLPVIILTAHGTIPDAISATRKGIFSYLTKPFDARHLLTVIEEALLQSIPISVNNDKTEDWRSGIISQSPLMDELLKQAYRAAQSDASILIQSDSGTGKELLAKAIHRASQRKNKPFVPINCAAIPDNLLESELFGHRKGAFTGAERDHDGLFAAAEGGTIFLDEIGDMPIEFQSKLLRVLEDYEIRPVGQTESTPTNVRIISATNHNLDEQIANGHFRDDLFYRLNVVVLELPTLAERREDIPMLTNHFLTKLQKQNSRCVVENFSPEAIELLVAAPWPGNIRQLLNVIEQVTVLSSSPIVPASLVERALRGKTGVLLPLAEAQLHFERDYLTKVLQISHGNVTHAARLARRNRTEFYRLLNKHHLEPETFRESE